MLRFLPGLILLQIITISLLLLAPETFSLSGFGWLRVAIPLLIIAVLMAFWFASLASQLSHEKIARLKEQHARERENLRVNAERAKHRVTRDAQKQVEKEIRRTSAKANFRSAPHFRCPGTGRPATAHPVHDPRHHDPDHCGRCPGWLHAALPA
ncbi:MAG: hypothetical protein R3E89_05920 [Thiolinea sp.]